MWTDIPVDNLLTIHTAHEIRTIQCCKQGYIFKTPVHVGGVQGNGMSDRNVILQFLWHSSLNVCLELKCGNYEMWNVLHQQQHKSYIYQLFVECKQLTSDNIFNKINIAQSEGELSLVTGWSAKL